MCEEDKKCKAALLSPSKECHAVDSGEAQITELDGWIAAIKYKCPGKKYILLKEVQQLCAHLLIK